MIVLNIILILVGGYIFGYLMEKIRIPKIIGMIIFGILIGPSILNLIDIKTIEVSPILRRIALIIIITRAGLSLNFKTLKEIGRPAILLSIIPALLEIIGVSIFGYLLFDLTYIDSLLLGSVMAAVSPAIIVPRMIKLKDMRYGEKRKVPDLIMASSSVDDILVITLFAIFLSIATATDVNVKTVLINPFVMIFLSLFIGVVIGYLLNKLIRVINNKVINTFIVIIISFLVVLIEKYINIDALIIILVYSIILSTLSSKKAFEVEKNYKKFWFVFEILLFVLVGIELNLKFAIKSGFLPIILVLVAIIFRVIGILISLIKTDYNSKEKRFIIYSLIPKATVQASIGAIALTNNIASGEFILTLAVLSILITAPIGAILIDTNYDKLLKKDMV